MFQHFIHSAPTENQTGTLLNTFCIKISCHLGVSRALWWAATLRNIHYSSGCLVQCTVGVNLSLLVLQLRVKFRINISLWFCHQMFFNINFFFIQRGFLLGGVRFLQVHDFQEVIKVESRRPAVLTQRSYREDRTSVITTYRI